MMTNATRVPRVGDDVLYGAPSGNSGPAIPAPAKVAGLAGGAGAADLVAFVVIGAMTAKPLRHIPFAPCLIEGHWTWPE